MGILNLFMPRRNREASQSKSNGSAPDLLTNRLHVIDTASSLASEEREWLRYLSQALRTYRKPGVSLEEEHQQWLAARAQSRALMAAANARVSKTY